MATGTPVQPTQQGTSNPVAIGGAQLGQTLKAEVDPTVVSSAGQPFYRGGQVVNDSEVQGIYVRDALDNIQGFAEAGFGFLDNAVIYVQGLIPNAITPAQKATNASLINAACVKAAAQSNVRVILPPFVINIGDNQVTLPPSHGVEFGGWGHSGLIAAGCCIKWEGAGDASADLQSTGVSATANAIGLGSLVFAIEPGVAHELSPGMPIRFTATAGTVGSVTGLVQSYYPDGLGNITVLVTSTTGAGVGTAWAYTTLLDKSPIIARSHEGLKLSGFTLLVSTTFAGRAIDIDGLVLGSDSSNYVLTGLTIYCPWPSGVPDPVHRPFGNMVAGIYGRTCNNSKLTESRIYGGLQGVCIRGVWGSISPDVDISFALDCALDCSVVGGEFIVQGEPNSGVPGFNYVHGGIRGHGCSDLYVSFITGDSAPYGPLIDLIGCVNPTIDGHLSILTGDGGAGDCAIRLAGCVDVTCLSDLSFSIKGFDVSGSTNIGLFCPLIALSPANYFFGTGIVGFFAMNAGTTNVFGGTGETQISTARLTNGASADNAISCRGAAPILNAYLQIAGNRTSDLVHGSANGASIELNFGGSSAPLGILYYSLQGNDATGHSAGHSFLAYDASTPSKQFVSLYAGPNGVQFSSPGGLAGPLVTVSVGGHLNFAATKLTNVAPATALTDAATYAQAKSGLLAGRADEGNSGAAKTIALNDGPNLKLTLTANCTLTLTPPTLPSTGTILVHQNGGFTLTWVGARFAGGVQPTQSAGAGAEDRYTWVYDGTTIDVTRFGAAMA